MTGEGTPLSIDDELSSRKELVGNLYCRLKITTRIATQVDYEVAEILLRQFGQSNQQFRIGILAKVLDADIATLIIKHITGGDALGRNLTTGNGDMAHFVLTITDNAQLHLRILRSLQAMHGLSVGTDLTHENGVVDFYNFVASQHTSTLSRTIADDILHTDGILTDGELNTNTKERTTEIVIRNLTLTGRDVDGMGIELCQNLGHSFFHQVVDIDRIHILIVNNMEQVVEFVTARIDDVQSVARKMVGIKGAHKDAEDYANGHPQGGKTTIFILHTSKKITSIPARFRRSMPSVRRYFSP